jgi:DNA-binding Xre family transcriptional regulator
MSPSMGAIRWKLDKFLDDHDITPYALAKEGKGLSFKVVYQLANNKTQGVRFDTLTALMDSLHDLTGESITFDDLLEYQPD